MKTLLLHVGDRADLGPLCGIATDLARRLQAHLVGVHAQTEADMPAAVVGRGASAVMLAERTQANRKLAQELADRFQETLRERGVAGEWRLEHGEPLDVLGRQSCFADLVLAMLPPPRTLEDRLTGPAMDRLPVVAACPVLLVPAAFAGAAVGRRILVSWKCEPVCARALREATPILQGAEEVVLLSLGEQDLAPLSRVAALLKRRDVRVKMRHEPDPESDIGTEILAQAGEMNADLIVMGAYGHSRLRELMLGGVTQRVLNESALPLLMSH